MLTPRIAPHGVMVRRKLPRDVLENWINGYAVRMDVCCASATLSSQSSTRRHDWKGRHDAPDEHPTPDTCLHRSPCLPPGSLHQPVLQCLRHVIGTHSFHVAQI